MISHWALTMRVFRIVGKTLQFMGTVLLCAWAYFPGFVVAQVMPPTPLSLHFAPRLVVPEARLPVRLRKVDIRAEVLGTAAHTRIEMVFFNPNERQLEGELQFPLLDGQTVTGFALDINGELRSAVPVDKAKGQQVFEDVARTKIDPALLEKTQGNNYKLRVYPLPVRGSRRVVLDIEETLSLDSADKTSKNSHYISYRLPLQFAETVGQLDVAVHHASLPAQYSSVAVRARLGAEQIEASRSIGLDSGRGSWVRLKRKNYTGKGILSIDFPRTGTSIATETRAGQTYFYAEVSPFKNIPLPRIAPKILGLVWDASGSGASRDHGREFALLDAYFKTLGSVTVELIVARDLAEATQSFSIENGDWRTLRTVLETIAYDGATSWSAMSPARTANLTLLFSDGLCNYGTGVLVTGNAPLYTVNAAASSDLPRLRLAAENAGGRLLNLLSTNTADALKELAQQYPRLVGLRSNGAKELVSASVYAEGNRLKIAGILAEPQATIELEWVNAQGQHKTEQVVIRNSGKSVTSLAAKRWAVLQLAQLESDKTANRAGIRRLGNRFAMVTGETSLIVLDRVEDYVRHEIVPPESLRGEYDSQLAKKLQQQGDERRTHLDDIARRFAQKVAWWEKPFPKDDKPKPRPLPATLDRGELGRAEVTDRVMAMAAAPSPVAMAPPRPVVSAPPPASESTPSAERSTSAEASIQLKKWQPDAPYARRLREAEPGMMYRVYLDERPAYINSTAFFLDAADIFIERGQPELGLRILSNLAEMNLENRQILRILSYRLLQAKQVKLALPILQQVLALASNEPQSWRDLGLAYADAAQFQLAVDNLWEVVARPWHDRFPDIELIALADLNALVTRTQQPLDTSRMDSRLLRNLPLDLRAVLSWDADNTDIDLWVTDPNNEKVFYGHRLGYQGGTMSRDFTMGYGPEEFSLRTAKPGKYKVEAQFYGNHQQVIAGATTLMLRLSTGFGTIQQKDENIVLRLSGQGAAVEVGTFEVAPGVKK